MFNDIYQTIPALPFVLIFIILIFFKKHSDELLALISIATAIFVILSFLGLIIPFKLF